jgi:dihydroxyacid dehydratase/phosphogluconate dehydratase
VIDACRKAPRPRAAEALAARASAWAPPPRYTGGVMAKYAALVSTASEGAVTTGRRMTAALAGR